MGARVGLFLALALLMVLSVSMANAANVLITSNTITTPIDYPQNASWNVCFT